MKGSLTQLVCLRESAVIPLVSVSAWLSPLKTWNHWPIYIDFRISATRLATNNGCLLVEFNHWRTVVLSVHMNTLEILSVRAFSISCFRRVAKMQLEFPISELKAQSLWLLLLYRRQMQIGIWKRRFSERDGLLQTRKRPKSYHRTYAVQHHLLESQNSNEVLWAALKQPSRNKIQWICGTTHLAVGRPTVDHSIVRYLSLANVHLRYKGWQDLWGQTLRTQN